MSFWGKVFGAFGFENEEEDNKKTKCAEFKSSSAYELTNSKFYKKLPPVRKIVNQEQLQQNILDLIALKSIIFDFADFDEKLKYRAIDFLAGAVFALEGDFKMLEDNKFLCRLEIEED